MEIQGLHSFRKTEGWITRFIAAEWGDRGF